MMYINRITNEFGLTIDDVRRAIPHASIPENTQEVGDFQSYSLVSPPPVEWDEESIEQPPTAGVQSWLVQKVSADAQSSILSRLASAVRAERNQRLSDCDWTQLPDAALTQDQKTAWQKYRQALRNVTASGDFPRSIEFPEMP